MKKPILVGASILSGLLLWVGWPVSELNWLLFIAWLPLLWVLDQLSSRSSVFGYCFLTMLVWNSGTTWWMWNSTDIGSIAAILFNSMLMCFPWWAYAGFRKQGRNTGYLALIACWMCFEFIHLNWELSWPWLTLGNGMAMHTNWIQWYEYTGVAGGTLWILLINIFIYTVFRNWQQHTNWLKPLCFAGIGIILPIVLSYLIKPTIQQNSKANLVVVQPNIDPYGKFNNQSASEQINTLLQLTTNSMDSATQLVIWPETAMSVSEWQDAIQQNQYYQPIFAFLQQHPQLTILSGIESYKNYGPDKATPTARAADNGTYYDAFNAAVQLHTGEPIQFYNKSKLVPGVESLPSFLRFMAPLFEQFGGTTGGYGKSDSSRVFHAPGSVYATAPIICYESVYGAYVGTYVKRGANILTIMTNDGWWGNTAGHKQHLQYARLRAIETRRWVARSANTGISAIIDPAGNILATEPWNKAAAIRYAVPVTDGLSVYVRFGDYLYILATAITVLLVLVRLYKKYSRPSKAVS